MFGPELPKPAKFDKLRALGLRAKGGITWLNRHHLHRLRHLHHRLLPQRSQDADI